MTEFRGTWTEAEVEAFLAEATVPIRLATHRTDGSLWMVALRYRYRNGSFECATRADADVVRLLRNDAEVAFDVSTNDVPYRGVRGDRGARARRGQGGPAQPDRAIPRRHRLPARDVAARRRPRGDPYPESARA